MTDANDGRGFDEQSKVVAQRFLRNVLLLDDDARMLPTGHAKQGARRADTPDSGDIGGELPASSQRAAGTDSLDAAELVRGFAKLGLMCAPLVPQVDLPSEEDEFVESVSDAAERADILVLDWWMSGNRNWRKSQLAQKVLWRLLAQDQKVGGRLRLIAVYTAEPRTSLILEKLRATIDKYYKEFESLPPAQASAPPEVNWISKGPVRLLVVPKGGAADVGTPVSVADLAERLVQEYAELTRGLLRNVAFRGLSVLRERAHQLLATFAPDTDPAFLIHRALLPEPDDAEGHVLEILSAELLSILEEQEVSAEAGDGAITGWLGRLGESKLGKVNGVLDWGGNKLEAWTRMLTKGVSYETRPQGVSRPDVDRLIKELLDKGTEALLGDIPLQPGVGKSAVSRAANQRFAYLMKMRNVYTQEPPYLTLGTVLYRIRDGSYFICLQAKCDCVRLRNSTPFPLLVLNNADGQPNFDLVVKDGSGTWVSLAVRTRTQNLVMSEFTPDRGPPPRFGKTQRRRILFPRRYQNSL